MSLLTVRLCLSTKDYDALTDFCAMVRKGTWALIKHRQIKDGDHSFIGF